MKTEPAIFVSTVTAFLTAIIGFAVAFGLDLTDAQQTAIIAAVAPAAAAIFLIGPAIRQFVYSPHTVQKKVDEAASQGAQGETPAPVVP